MTSSDIAKVYYAANQAFCQMRGNHSMPDWKQAPESERADILNRVEFHLANPEAGPSHKHEVWLKEQVENGWKYGPTKDPRRKEHPCIVPYEKLPTTLQAKNALLVSVVQAIRPCLELAQPTVAAAKTAFIAAMQLAINQNNLEAATKLGDSLSKNLSQNIAKQTSGKKPPIGQGK